MTHHFDATSFRPALVARGPRCAGATDVGRVRRRNEDAFWISEDGTALAVADGLGGLPGGDVASSLAMAAVADELGPGADTAGHAPDPAAAQARLAGRAWQAAARAQRALMEAARSSPALYGMATTLVLVLVGEDFASVLQIGDSRAALWRDGRVARTTIDQNFAADLVRDGKITIEEARVHPSRNMVREVVGHPDGYEAECHTWPIEPGDVLVVFTDGVSEVVSEQQITQVLASAPDAAAAASTLVQLAASEGGHDNATVVVRYVT